MKAQHAADVPSHPVGRANLCTEEGTVIESCSSITSCITGGAGKVCREAGYRAAVSSAVREINRGKKRDSLRLDFGISRCGGEIFAGAKHRSGGRGNANLAGLGSLANGPRGKDEGLLSEFGRNCGMDIFLASSRENEKLA